MKITDTLKKLSIPAAFGRFTTAQEPPFVVYLGAGQDHFAADNADIIRNAYQVEYYFTCKNEAREAEIEKALAADGWAYEKSGDTYIQDEDLWVIYYDVRKRGW